MAKKGQGEGRVLKKRAQYIRLALSRAFIRIESVPYRILLSVYPMYTQIRPVPRRKVTEP